MGAGCKGLDLNRSLWNSESPCLLKLITACAYSNVKWTNILVYNSDSFRGSSLESLWPRRRRCLGFLRIQKCCRGFYSYYSAVGSRSSFLLCWFCSTIAISRTTSYMTNEFTAAAASRSTWLPKRRHGLCHFPLLLVWMLFRLTSNTMGFKKKKKKMEVALQAWPEKAEIFTQ